MVRTMEVWDMLSPGRPNLYNGGVAYVNRLPYQLGSFHEFLYTPYSSIVP